MECLDSLMILFMVKYLQHTGCNKRYSTWQYCWSIDGAIDEAIDGQILRAMDGEIDGAILGANDGTIIGTFAIVM